MITYGKRNNIKLETRIPWRCSYVYVDTPEHRCDQLFIRSEIPVRFKKGEMYYPGYDYVIVFCHFNKRYEEMFLECMANLERTMVIEGHSDYSDFCEKRFYSILEEGTDDQNLGVA